MFRLSIKCAAAFLLASILPASSAMAQNAEELVLSKSTAKYFKVKISADGKSDMQVFLPQNPNGKMVVGCPGGGYSHLSMQNEGTDWAEYFNKQGIAYGVLRYRMPGGDRTLPMSDAQTAIKMARDSADAWKINAQCVGIMGFSAGGHLASTTATHASAESLPNFQILFYPVISMVEKETHKGSVVNFLGDKRSDESLVAEFTNYRKVSATTPPAIILMAADDKAVPPLTNGITYYEALRKAGISVAMYVYPSGGHGFGFKSKFRYHNQMVYELTEWLKDIKVPTAAGK